MKHEDLLWDDGVFTSCHCVIFFIYRGKSMSNDYFKKFCPDYNSSYLGCNTGCPHNNCTFNRTIEKPLYKWKDGTFRTVKETESLDK